MNHTGRTRILFFGEGVTLAHVSRPFVLANSLNNAEYEVVFASSSNFKFLLNQTTIRHIPIQSISPDDFLKSIETGTWLYTKRVLRKYVEEDLKVIDEVRPDEIVGDMRLSLGISAALTRTPYSAITNAYWSPYVMHTDWPVPDYTFTRILGVKLASHFFRLTKKPYLKLLASFLNGVRTEYSLPPFTDFLEGFTFGDRTFYSDLPLVVPTHTLPSNHSYIGPIIWSPAGELPGWWSEWRGETSTPLIYLSLGSSGPVKLLPLLVSALSTLNAKVIVSTAGRWTMTSPPSNVRVTDFLPGDIIASAADLVISNGGSPTTYQALKEGTPVIGIASNLDQFVFMDHVAKLGAGLLLRSSTLSARSIKEAVGRILTDSAFKDRAVQVKTHFAEFNPTHLFLKHLNGTQHSQNVATN